jgi:UDP-N-acetylmuramyl pentapeptide synthase
VAFGDQGRVCASPEELLSTLRGLWRAEDVLLVKGSRLAAMDRIADALCSGTRSL